ncbi:MAG: thiamine-phosphate kinase [Bacteroidetes bacterium]|nr:thiamine-phosphate kinase [Bacteroidota bacterium]
MDFENKQRTEIASLGEFELINHLTKNFEIKNNSSVRGIGDDAAVIFNEDKKTLVSTDMLVEGVHFDLTYVPLKHLGYKSIVVNLSDIFAMNAVPQQVLVSIAISNRFSLEAIEELYSGMYLACEKYKIDLIGGDTTSSLSGLTLSITVIGSANSEKISYRNGAKANDLLCVSGDLGAAYIGLQVLEREKFVFQSNKNMQPDLEGKDYILQRQLKPEAREDVIKLLHQLDIIPSSMIDISDGLSSEILHICKQSNVGAQVYEEKLPIDQLTYNTALEFNIDPTTCALNGGEDYELLFTISMQEYEKIKSQALVTVIGHITSKESGCNLITKNGSLIELKAQGWNSFSK